MTTADAGRLGYVGRQPGKSGGREVKGKPSSPSRPHPNGEARDSESWFTPARYLEAVREVLGGRIDLDPYTSEAANVRVGARLTYTRERPCPEGARWPVVEAVFMNPPYSGAAVLRAVELLIDAYQAERFKRGIVLVAAAVDARFFHRLLGVAAAVCLVRGRIGFENVDGKRISGNTRGSAFFYLGQSGSDRFRREFQAFGYCLRCR